MDSAPLVPLAMSQTKDDLLKHLNMDLDTYNLMAKEADRIYKWLTSEKNHLKKNCKRKPPYDWSDILENSKDDAIKRIAQSGDAHTSYYWNLAVPTEDCPNWIARWFLYHKFRYRDGRNRSVAKGSSKGDRGKFDSRRSGTSGSSRESYQGGNAFVEQSNDGHDQIYDVSPYYSGAGSSNSTRSAYGYAPTDNVDPYSNYSTYTSAANTTYTIDYAPTDAAEGNNTVDTTKPYYDPVRDL